MAKTLLIKLAETIDDDTLPYLGEIRIGIKPFSTTGSTHEPDSYTQNFTIGANEPIPMELTGDGHFTDSTLTQDLGKTYTMPAGNNTMYVSDGNSILKIRNKYALTKISIPHDNSKPYATRSHWSLNVNQLAYMKSLGYLDGYTTTLSGDMSVFKTTPNILHMLLALPNGSMTGDLSDIAHLTRMNFLALQNNKSITGDIASFAGFTNLTTLWLSGCSLVTGSTSSIAALHPNNGGKLENLYFSNTKVTGSWPPA